MKGTRQRAAAAAALLMALAGCATSPRPPLEREAQAPAVASAPPSSLPAPAPAIPPVRRGAYYEDDGPGDAVPADLDRLPDAVPRAEALHRFANNPYVALGREYLPARALKPFRQRGTASWYGRKFHGQRTSSGEIYDMYGMTAAHPTLPIPSYARVTNVATGNAVVVRVNDRGPFLHDRVIDLSYAAAYKLGYVTRGSALVEVEAVIPGGSPAAATYAGTAPAAVAAAAIPIAAEPGGLYLQLGAFTARANAETFSAHLMPLLAWLDRAIGIYRKDGLFRLHVGPYRDRSEALAVAARIRDTLDVKPHVVVR